MKRRLVKNWWSIDAVKLLNWTTGLDLTRLPVIVTLLLIGKKRRNIEERTTKGRSTNDGIPDHLSAMESVTDAERKRKEISNAVSFDCFWWKKFA
jgi:hypothetical protein